MATPSNPQSSYPIGHVQGCPQFSPEIKIQEPAKFHGFFEEDALEWLQKLELYIEVKGFSSAYKQALVLASNLAEPAQLWYLGLEDGLKRDYTLLKDAFVKAFVEHWFKTEELASIHNFTLTNPHQWYEFEWYEVC